MLAGDHERFQDVQRAYDCLKDPARRREYDAAGGDPRAYEEGGFRAGGAQGFGGGGAQGFGGFGGGRVDMEDIMREFFGGGAFGGGMGGMRREDGATVQVEVEVSLREAAKGLRRTISLPEVDAAGRQTGGVRQVELDIPAGVGSGVRLQMRGMGGPPRTGQGRAGDLLVQVRVRPDPTFERDGDDVHVEASVPFPTAALGGSVRVPTLDGDISMRVGAGTQGGAQLRLRARGMPRLRGGGRGDQFVHLKVDVPRRLTPRARELLEQLQEELTDGAAGDRAGGKRARAAGAY